VTDTVALFGFVFLVGEELNRLNLTMLSLIKIQGAEKMSLFPAL
jgi:hypothetical protein